MTRNLIIPVTSVATLFNVSLHLLASSLKEAVFTRLGTSCSLRRLQKKLPQLRKDLRL